jgi:hypothetical protein
MIVNVLVAVFGILIFLFVFWKRLKDDFSSEIIFRTSAAILIGIGLGWLISYIFIPMYFFWTSTFFALLTMFLMIMKYKLRFYETLEALIMASMPWLAIIFLEDSITTSSLTSFLAFTTILVMIFLSYWFDVNYKNFTWYKSGKIGFAGLSIAFIFFLIRSVLAIMGITMLSFVVKFEFIISGVITLISLILLISLGKKKE